MKSSNDGKNRLALSGELLYHILRIIRHEGYTGYIITHSVRSQHIPELQIVDIELFKEANKMVSLRCNANAEARKVAQKAENNTLLAGIVYCAHCGARMSGFMHMDRYKLKNGKVVEALKPIKSILRNEKYCGDVLMQKTFQQDVINRRVIKNTGQLPMYLIENHHEGIVSREKYNAVQAEMARRKAAKSPSKRASTGLSAYTSRYALSDRLVCGECGTLYRRCTWTRPDGKRVVWRCVSRLDYGKKYCHSSPTLDEVPLQQAIIAALNTVLPDLDGRIRQITEALEAEVIPFPGSGMSLGDIDRRLTELEAQFQRLLEKAADDPIAYGDQFKEILDEQTALKELRATILAENKKHAEADRRIRDAAGMLENAVPHIAEWDESAIRQLVAQVKVLSKNEISVTLKSGIEIRQSISN